MALHTKEKKNLGCCKLTNSMSLLIRSYKCAVVLCDMSWLDPDMEVANGIAATEQSDMLRLDAMILMVQLNIRKLVEVRHLCVAAQKMFVKIVSRGLHAVPGTAENKWKVAWGVTGEAV